jgi:hypothetical protein
MFLNGIFEAYTLEPPTLQPPNKPRAVPAGLYDWTLYASPRFGRSVVRVEDIVGFEDIEVHPGNFPRDTHGCCLVGRTEGTDFVGQSDVEFDALMAKLPPTGQIEYVDPT